MQSRCVCAELLQCFCHFVAYAFGIAEHHGLTMCCSNVGNDAIFVHVMNRQEQMAHRSHRVGWRINGHFFRVLHVSLNEVAHLPIECG